MPVNINVAHRAAITYRTDCLSTYSQNKYHVRATARGGMPIGYEEIVGTGDGLSVDIGHNPGYTESGQRKHLNPIICDKLIFFGDFSNNHDLYYDRMIFQTPALFLDNAQESVSTGNILVSDNFKKITAVYAFMDIYADGQQYYSWSQSYSSFTEQNIINTQSSRTGTSYKIAVNRAGYTSRTPQIHTQSELLARFQPRSANQTEFRSVLNTFLHGGLELDRYDFMVHIYNNDSYGGSRAPAYKQATEYMIVPFISEYEREAAKAALYEWSAADIQAVREVIQ